MSHSEGRALSLSARSARLLRFGKTAISFFPGARGGKSSLPDPRSCPSLRSWPLLGACLPAALRRHRCRVLYRDTAVAAKGPFHPAGRPRPEFATRGGTSTDLPADGTGRVPPGGLAGTIIRNRDGDRRLYR